MKFVAERELLYAEKGKHHGAESLTRVIIRVSQPIVATEENTRFQVDGKVAVCRVTIEGLDEPGSDFYGMDSLQAINLASDIDPLIKRLSDKYDFFWTTGEPYFEE